VDLLLQDMLRLFDFAVLSHFSLSIHKKAYIRQRPSCQN